MNTATATATFNEDGLRDSARASDCLVVAFECARPLARPTRMRLHGVREVLIGRGEGRSEQREPGGSMQLRLPDARTSSRHACLSRSGDGWTLRDLGSKNGTFLNGVRVTSAPLADGALIEVGGSFLLLRLADPADFTGVDARSPLDPTSTCSSAMARAIKDLEKIAVTSLPVLISGETGTGKERFAHALHALSGREGPFLALNCGALAESLLDSELFGHRRGAFSGATHDRPGLVRSAERGTLLLDEIVELSAAAQVKLLRVIQERQVLPVGSYEAVNVDVRLLGATHANLEQQVAAGSFRHDLYERLASYQLRLPALRERSEDIGLLIASILERDPVRAACLQFSREAARALFLYRWPGNIRELERTLAVALALCEDTSIGAEHLPASLLSPTGADAIPLGSSVSADGLRERLVQLLTLHAGNVSAVAREMGKARVQIDRWCRRYDLHPSRFRVADE